MNANDPGSTGTSASHAGQSLKALSQDNPAGTLAVACDLVEETLAVDSAGDDVYVDLWKNG